MKSGKYETVAVTYDGTIYRVGKDKIPDPDPKKWNDGPFVEVSFYIGPITPKTVVNAYSRLIESTL